MLEIERKDELHKKLKHSGVETNKDNFKAPKMHLQEMILKRKGSHFDEELAEIRNRPK